MIKRILLPLCLLGIISCSNTGVSVLEVAEETDTLKMRVISLSEELLMPTKMIASCGEVVIYQRKGDDVFVLVDVEGGECNVIGRKGRGPNEFTSIDVQSLAPTSDGFVCMDSGGRIKKVSLGDKVTVSTSQTVTFGHPQNGILIKDEFIAMNVANTESEYMAYSATSEKPRLLSEYPDWTGNTSQPLPFVYLKNMVAHPTENMFASFYVYFRKLRILNGEGRLLSDIDVRLPDEFPPYSSDASSRNFAYASYPCATEQYIYALCRNSDRESLKTVVPEIHVFDWSGQLKKRYVADRYFDLFAIDEERGMLYAMDINNADALYVQQLK